MDRCAEILAYIAPQYAARDYASLEAQYQEWATTKPLSGMRILDATPLFDNTLLKYRNLLAAGADLTIGLAPFISHNAQTLSFVQEKLALHTISNHQTKSSESDYDLILDCAGAYSHLEARVGYVELTRSGIEYYKGHRKPVYFADSSTIKEIETEYGTGDSMFRALEQLGYHDFKGKKIVIFGSGKVGRGIRGQALARSCAVSVVTVVSDRTSAPTDCPVIDFRDTEAALQAIQEAWAVVMATGVVGALGATLDAKRVMASQALLINMGAQDEFGDQFVRERLLEDGRTLNFILSEPTHLRYIAPTMTLHNYGAKFLLENRNLTGIIKPSAEIEKQILKNFQNSL
ncbi:MAG: hypothetical protein RSC35_01570 [Mucinivorans sp.]